MPGTKPSIAVFYHFFPPDNVVSAVHVGDLCAGLAERGWQVTAYPNAWSSADDNVRFAAQETWQGVSVRRIWRPNLQSSHAGRFLNAAWMIFRWSLLSITARPRPDVLFIGTDPILSLTAAHFWRLFSPRTRIVHWCFDLYPEAAIAGGLLPPRGLFTRFFRRLMGSAYRRCALIIDLGPCMRRCSCNIRPKPKEKPLCRGQSTSPSCRCRCLCRSAPLLFADAPLGIALFRRFRPGSQL